MAGHVGEWLRERRLTRKLSLGALGVKAGVHPSTLSRWETAKQQPSLRELEAVLNALGASQAQRREALQQIEAPRAVQQVRKEAGHSPPAGGDLLRAMRIRRQLTQAETAARIGVTQSLLAKWERSESWPPVERLHALCYALEAYPEELLALTTQRFWLPDDSDTPFSYEAYRQQSHHVYMQNDQLRDLRFFSLEAKLWRYASQSPRAEQLLRLAYAHHARALLETTRFAEANALMQRWPGEPIRVDDEPETFPQMTIVAASLAGQRDQRKAIQILKDAVTEVQDHDYRSWLLAEMGIFLTQIGQAEASIKISETACRVAMRSRDAYTVWFRERDKARMLMTANRFEEAMQALEAASPLLRLSEDARVRHLLLETECWVGLQELSRAQRCVEAALQAINTHSMEYLRLQAEALALLY